MVYGLNFMVHLVLKDEDPIPDQTRGQLILTEPQFLLVQCMGPSYCSFGQDLGNGLNSQRPHSTAVACSPGALQ